jgi:hypothetical protein
LVVDMYGIARHVLHFFHFSFSLRLFPIYIAKAPVLAIMLINR